ncbi:CtsR family transcriptional regulator [Desulfitibacter alkalitolerans]|uniref:CtsR family transcriptional regulator n=1 Tax=Desulfitibacter alkalitolerans TaxID=264641 RepID=UPI000481B1C7|nr:CtsR family transcriptional regulator [Desulfitibacter alkalitolerans]
MSSLANKIQKYINELLANSKEGYIELQRSKLAEQFVCVPSQINYVLGTRFTIKQGYVVESQQGGGGYLRIIKLPLTNAQLLTLIDETIDKSVSEHGAMELLKRLYNEDLLTFREMLIMKSLIQRETLDEGLKRDEIRARLIKAMLITLLRQEFQQN